MFLKVLLFAIFINSSLFSCGFWIDPQEKEFVFVENRDYFFLNYSDLNHPADYNSLIYNYDTINKLANLAQWQEDLKNQYSIEELEEFIYKRKNLEKIKDSELLEYIRFVEKQENCVVSDYYNYRTPSNNCNIDTLIPEALTNLNNSNSEYLKLRYFYLALRLAHYNFKEPLKIYEKYKYLLKNDKETVLKDWIQALYAGALVKNEKTIEGVYEFSKLLDKKVINSHLSFYNFKYIKSDEQFNALLKLAKNNEEKTKFYLLRSLDSSSNSLEELKNIYNIDKNSQWFDLLLFRELLTSQLFFNQNVETQFEFPKGYVEFLKTIKKDNMYMVDLSLAYFSIYEKGFEQAIKSTQKLLNEYPNSHEVQTLNYILYLNKLEKIDIKTENEIYEKMQELTKDEHFSTSIHDYTFRVILNKLYEKQNDKLNAFLALNINYLDFGEFDLELIQKFETFMNEKPNSKIKEHFQTKFKNRIEESKKYIENSFETAKTKALINNLKFKEALETKNPILDEKIEFNPFNSFIKGNNRKGSNNSMTIKDFLEKTISIKKELEKNPKSAMDNYLLANALYNLSYFGSVDRVTVIYRHSYSIQSKDLQNEKLNLALKHYNIALENTKDKEFKAKIIYSISKTKLALFDLNLEENYFNKYTTYNNEWNYGQIYSGFIKSSGAKYFDTLQKDFSDTKYYKELLKECGDFRTYINSKD